MSNVSLFLSIKFNILSTSVSFIISVDESELTEAEVNFFAKYALVPPVLVHKLGINNL